MGTGNAVFLRCLYPIFRNFGLFALESIMNLSRYLIAIVIFNAALSPAAGVAAAPAKGGHARPAVRTAAAMAPEQIVSEIHKRFVAQKFRTITYDETRVVSYESLTPGKKGLMNLNLENGAMYMARYFYQAPAKHGYRDLSKPIKNFWIGSPNQPGALPMDEKWKDKVLSWFNLYGSPPRTYRGKKCYLVTLVPKPGAPKNLFNMTWYVDPADFTVLKFIFLITDSTSTISSTGEMYYKPLNGYMLPYKANWRTKVSSLPYIFMQRTTIKNYRINIPLDESVFKEVFPENWFKNLNEKPYK